MRTLLVGESERAVGRWISQRELIYGPLVATDELLQVVFDRFHRTPVGKPFEVEPKMEHAGWTAIDHAVRQAA